MEKVLVIEDDRHIAEILGMALATQHFTPIVASDGGMGLSEARRLLPSLILLDLMLPIMDGREVCRLLRADEKTRHIPIIIVTAKGEEEDRVAGLELGADDYVVKPFSTRELVARIRSVFRRRAGQASAAGLVRVGELEIDVDRHVITIANRSVNLTIMEFTILQRLAQDPGRVFTRDQLLTLLWGEDCFMQEHSLDVHIHAIRKKIEADPGHPLYIQTVHGVGYKLKEPGHQRSD
ncbi:MAG: DNA-binding response regulator [Nitrospiraceae bacterium]|nr:MAG: DNA-binding response regulator [Nitrospiraceae bacterium]